MLFSVFLRKTLQQRGFLAVTICEAGMDEIKLN